MKFLRVHFKENVNMTPMSIFIKDIKGKKYISKIVDYKPEKLTVYRENKCHIQKQFSH